MKLLKQNYLKIFIILPIFSFLFSLFYNINWGTPYYFHPDERNIATSVSQLYFPQNMNPHFFAYGTLPIYITYLEGAIKGWNTNVSFESAILIGRINSAILSLLLLLLIYKTSKLIGLKRMSAVPVLLAFFSIGYIQYSHFSTFEMWLSFFTLLLFSILLRYLKEKRIRFILYISFLLGVLISIKISSLVFLPFISSIIFIKELLSKKKHLLQKYLLLIFIPAFIIATGTITTFLTSPYIFLDPSSFLSSIQYESNVATGTLPVFYSGGFKDTIPVLYQLIKVYPFALNPLITILGILSIFFVSYHALRHKNTPLILVILFFGITFFSQSFLYVKWIRYYIPTLAFIYLLVGFMLEKITNNISNQKIKIIIPSVIILISFIYALSFFITVYVKNDTRVEAYNWARKNIPKNSKIVSEVYDLGIVPFNESFSDIELFNFYELDDNPVKSVELDEKLKSTGYIILPSQRVLKNRMLNKEAFPKGHEFYSKLSNGDLGFKKVYETPCDIFCKITYFGNPIFSYEETANVFDRPNVLIFKNEN